MATEISGTFAIREDLSRVIEVSDHRRDLSSTTVKVRLLSDSGAETVVGSSTGTDVGTAFTINADFDIDPGFYYIEIGPDDGPIVFPQDEATPGVHVIDTRYHS